MGKYEIAGIGPDGWLVWKDSFGQTQDATGMVVFERRRVLVVDPVGKVYKVLRASVIHYEPLLEKIE